MYTWLFLAVPRGSLQFVIVVFPDHTHLLFSTNPTKSNPWYNDDCKEAIKQRKEALTKFKKSPNTNNFNDIKVFKAKACRTIKISKRKSWRSYVLKINHKTPIKKLWIW